MRHHIFLGGNKDELFFEEVNTKFLVHKNLINENTRDMIQLYVASLRAPVEIRVYPINNVYIFEPEECEMASFLDGNEDYLWFVL